MSNKAKNTEKFNELSDKNITVNLYDLVKFIQIYTSSQQEKNGERYWTKTDIANYIGVSYRSLDRTILNLKNFPSPVILAGDDGKQTKRWLNTDIKKYFASLNKDQGDFLGDLVS